MLAVGPEITVWCDSRSSYRRPLFQAGQEERSVKDIISSCSNARSYARSSERHKRHLVDSASAHRSREVLAFLLDAVFDSEQDCRLPLVQLAHLVVLEQLVRKLLLVAFLDLLIVSSVLRQSMDDKGLPPRLGQQGAGALGFVQRRGPGNISRASRIAILSTHEFAIRLQSTVGCDHVLRDRVSRKSSILCRYHMRSRRDDTCQPSVDTPSPTTS